MEAKKFITRPDIMAIYKKEGMTSEVLASITEVAGYQIAKKEDKKEAGEDVIETPEVETPEVETPEVEEPTTEQEEVTPTEEPVEEPEIIVEEENKN